MKGGKENNERDPPIQLGPIPASALASLQMRRMETATKGNTPW